MPGQAKGNSIFHSTCLGDMPQQAAASRISLGIEAKARCIGWIAKGRLKMIEASTNPSKLKTKVVPIVLLSQRPSP